MKKINMEKVDLENSSIDVSSLIHLLEVEFKGKKLKYHNFRNVQEQRKFVREVQDKLKEDYIDGQYKQIINENKLTYKIIKLK